jgi:glycogen debranching enzyme
MLRHVSHTFSTDSAEEQDSLGRKRYLPKKRMLVDEQYYLPYLGFRSVGEWFDSLGHLLALIARVPDDEQARRIFDMIDRYELAQYPMRALHPVITQGDPDWRSYYGMLNVPCHYHNGGVWPFIGGFYVAALVASGQHEKASAMLSRLAELNRTGEFNEWHHGLSGIPMGVRDQAWSSAMYIYAYECVRRQSLIHFAANAPGRSSSVP